MKENSEVCDIRNFWNKQSCGEALYLYNDQKIGYELQRIRRYQLEPYIIKFAEFEKYSGKWVLEIGVGLGADHQMFAEAGANLSGIDLTERAIEHVKKRFSLFFLQSNLQVANAETLNFEDNSYDLIYSWGVIHHSPNTERIIDEIYRILKPNGTAKIMIYHKYSVVGFMLWLRFALFYCKPWLTLKTIYANHLESQGTKAYSRKEANLLFSKFKSIQIKTILTHADLLESNVGQKHRGKILFFAKKFWPRWFLKMFFKQCGLFMMITAEK